MVPPDSRLRLLGPNAVIQRGRATVSRDGGPVPALGPGDFFGEVALLQGGARKATVEAATDVRVRVVPYREFAHAMRTLPTLARVVRSVIRERAVAVPSLVAA
jgi:CRP-like cAMP-binding protein